MADGFQMKPLHPIATVLNHLRMIVIIGVIGTVVLAGLVLMKVKPLYNAESSIEIMQNTHRIMVWDAERQFNSRVQYTDYVNTLLSYILSDETLSAALEKIPFPNHALIPGDDEHETIMRLRAGLQVAHVRDTYLVVLRMEGTDARDLDVVINAVVDAFLERMTSLESGRNDTRVRFLKSEMEGCEAELQDKYALLAEYSQRLGTFNFDETANPYDQNLEFLREALNNAYLARVQAENDHAALSYSSEREEELGTGPEIEAFVYEDRNTAQLRDAILEAEREQALADANITDKHPRALRLRSRTEQTRAEFEETSTESRRLASEIFDTRMSNENLIELARAEAELAARSNTEREISSRFNEELDKLKETTPDFLKAAQIKAEIERLEERLTGVQARLEDLMLESNAESRVQLQSRAFQPKYPQDDKRKMLLIVVCGMSFACGLFLAFAIDFLDPRVIDPRYIGQLIDSPVTGMLTHAEYIDDFGQLIREAPERYIADQFRRIMPKIFSQSTDEDKREVFAVVSPSHLCGATSFSLNCLAHLKRTGRRAGLLEVSTGDATIERRTEGWGFRQRSLDLGDSQAASLPLQMRSAEQVETYHFDQSCGKEEISNEDLLTDLLERLKARTGCLIVDCPPLLKDSETELLCKQADVVVLVISGPRNQSGEVKKCMALLNNLGVKKCAVIANDLPLLTGGYISKAIAHYEGTESRFHLVWEILDGVAKAAGLSDTRIQELIDRFGRDKWRMKIRRAGMGFDTSEQE